MLSYAQNFEDVWLARLFDGKRDGFYIDIGASHPESLSVTKHFYDLGWHGINIEPLPEPFSRLQAGRPRDLNLQVAIDCTRSQATCFQVVGQEVLSTMDPVHAKVLANKGYTVRPVTVETRPLSDIVARHVDREVDFVKIDVEGAEAAVLASADWRIFRPRVLLIEATVPDGGFSSWDASRIEVRCPWEPALLDAGYVFAFFDGLNRYYLRAEDRGLLPRFSLPLGHWDQIEAPAAKLLSLKQQLQDRFDMGFKARAREFAGYVKRRILHSVFTRLQAWVETPSRPGRREPAARNALRFPTLGVTPPEPPPSPIDGKPAERFLFRTGDTRFGDPGSEDIHLDERHGIAITSPSRSAEELEERYRSRYNAKGLPTIAAAAQGAYQGFDRRPAWVRALHRLPTEPLLHRWVDLTQDPTLGELQRLLRDCKVDLQAPLRVLDVGCFDGALLDDIRARTPWQADGLEPSVEAAARAAAKGHRVWVADAKGALAAIPLDRHYDVIFMGQAIEHVLDPVLVVRRLRHLLAPGGHLVMSTPNLDSVQIDWFGPTWAHWHPPYHRHIFSDLGLRALVRQAGLSTVRTRSSSNAYWSALSLGLSRLGVGAFISHVHSFDPAMTAASRRIQFWQKALWDRIGRGDYLFIAAKEGGDA